MDKEQEKATEDKVIEGVSYLLSKLQLQNIDINELERVNEILQIRVLKLENILKGLEHARGK